MKNFLLFNQLFGTEGSPNQTGKTLAPSDERAMTARRPRGEKEQLSPSCLLLASYLPLTCPLYLRRVAMILCVLILSIGQMWGETITITPELVTNCTVTYEYTAGSGTSIKDKELWVEVPNSTVSGQVFIMGSDNKADRFAYIYKTNGSVKDTERKIAMQKDTYPDPLLFTSGDIKTSGGRYYLVFSTSDDFKYSKVKFALVSTTKISTSNFYQLYASSEKTAAQLIAAASLPSYIDMNANAVLSNNGCSSSVTTPHDFSSISSGTTYYRLKPNSSTITLYALANVKSIRLYGNGKGGGRTVTVGVTKISGSGSAMTVSSLSMSNAEKAVAEYTTGNLTSLAGYDANTYYNYTFTIPSNDSHLWGIYVEAGAATTYTVTYNANGGSVDPTSATQASAGASVTLPTPIKTGYRCTGWYTESSGGTKKGNYGESYTPTANETLYAQWAVNWKFMYNGDSYAEHTFNSSYQWTQELGGNTTYWFRLSDGGSTVYRVGAASTMTSASCTDWNMNKNASTDCGITTTAAGNYTFTIDDSDPANKVIVDVTYPSSVAITVNLNGHGGDNYTWYAPTGGVIPALADPSATGYKFRGWYTDASCTAGNEWNWSTTVNSAMTLYAKWDNCYIYYGDNLSGGFSDHDMTESADGNYWYWKVISWNANRYFKIKHDNITYDLDSNHPYFYCTDINTNSSANSWTGTEYKNCAVYYDGGGDYYVIVFVPNTGVNTTDYPKICASTFLPESSYAVTAGRKIYFDNSSVDWTLPHYRIGHKCYTSQIDMTKVKGTANLYECTTTAFSDYNAFHIADNKAWTGDHNIYAVRPGSYDIDNCLAFQKYAIDGDFTLTPTTSSGTNPTYYDATKTSGMKTDRVTISPYENGTITVNYVNTSNSAATLTSGSADLAHTVILTSITAVPNTGYEIDDAITINGDPYSANYVVTGPTTIAASFKKSNYTITHNSATNGTYTISVAGSSAVSTNTTANYGQTITLAASPSTGYALSGWTVTKAGGGTVTVTSNQFTMPAEAVTVTATFAPIDYTVTKTLTNCAVKGGEPAIPATMNYGGDLSTTIEATTGFVLPSTITVTGVESYTWDKSTGALTLTDVTGNVSVSIVATAAASQTALVINTLYEVPDMIPSGASLTSDDKFFDGLSANTKFELIGSGSDETTPKVNNSSSNDKTIDGITFDDGSMWFKGEASLTSNIPTTYGLSFIVPEGGGKLYLYFSTANTNIKLAKAGSAGSTPTLTDGYAAEDVTAGTYYLYGTNTSGNYRFYGLKLCSTYSVSITPTNVTKETGATGTGAAIHGRAYEATFTANTGFALPDDATVTIGGVEQTKGTGYTWTVSSGTGTLTVPAEKVTGAIVVTISGETPSGYTVTYNYNGATGGNGTANATGASVTLPTPTKSGYTFDGWYTSGGTKAGVGGATYNPTADITLYAQWRENCVGTATTLKDINFKDAAWSDKTFNQGNTNDEDEINGVYFWAKSDNASKQFSLTDNTTKGLTFPDNNISSGNYYFCIPITGINSSNKQITITLKHGYDKGKAQFKYVYVDGRTEYVAGNTNSSGGTAQSDTNNSDTEITFTLSSLKNNAGHLMIGRSSSSYTNIYGVTVTTPGAAGTCYYVTYNGNGATGGYTTDEAAYASGDEATAATNSFTKTGYTFGGWATSQANADAGTKTYDAGDKIAISDNTTLYAIWQVAGYTLAWNSNGGSALSGTYSSGSFADGATITAPNDPTRANYTFDSWNTARDGTGNAYTGTMPAANTTYYAVWKNTLTLKKGSQGSESDKSPTVFLDGSSLNGFSAHKAAGYTLQGYYTAATGGTKVLNADGSFAASNIARFVTSGKWSRTTGDTILVAQWESSYLLKWNLQLNKAEDAISTTSKESATARITTASMTNLTNNGGLTITSSKKTDLTSQIETPFNLTGAESKYMSVSFDVTAGYQLLPSAVKVMVQPVGNGENKYAKLILEDDNSHSISTIVECEGTEKGKKTTVTLSNAGRTVFTGTVTLKILVYNKSGASTTNNCYRLGSPIQIDGAIEAACNLPSYEGLEYDQTEYTVGDVASAIRVTGGSANTYKWKWNSTNDRSTGTEVGTNDASYTPLTTISEVGTRYYWCELKNDDCDGVVKTPAVAVTVSSAVTATTVTWTEPEDEPNYGGGGYVIRATVDQTEWGGTLGESNLVAPAGIHITRVATGTDGGKRYIEATFDVTTAFNRDENEVIVFGLTHDAVTGYSAISVTDTIDYDACSGGEDGSAAIALTSAIHDEGSGNAPRYWFETSGVGRVFGINYGKATLSTSSDDTFDTEGYSYVASSTSQRWVFQPYVDGVSKIRVYIKSATNTLKVLSIGKNASWQDQSSKYSNIAVDTIIYSNGKTTGLDDKQKGYAEIQFSSALTKNNYYMITMSSSSTYIYGITLYSESVGDGGNLATSLTFANAGPIDADASTANFQNIASKSGENRNTLGTITYSSNNDAATVNATTGEVSIHAKATAQAVTITATLSASGCYQGATATYTINVAADVCGEPSGSIELTTGSATKCESKSVTLTMTGFTSGATVEWYNGDTKVNGVSGYTIETSGSTSTLKTSNAGTYSAIAKVDGGCPSGAGRTNSITISNISVDASATKIVDKWYVKNGRPTPDIALWQLSEGATLKEVTIVRNVSGEGSLGLTSGDFVARDGIVYLSGKEPSANETGADIEYTLTLTVKDACGDPHEITEKTITLTHQKNTDKHVLAFVVNGTEKGDWTAGVTAAQTTTVGLYNEIAANFDVLATNIYSTDNEQKLKEYYSQFDILCITDYPNTQTKGANSKSYVDAIGSLIDIRPILTMEAFVSKLENWKVKGISGNPKSPSTRQYTMLLQCKDHEIFAGTELTTIGEGDETMYRVSMVDSTKEDYATLDSTYGATLPHKEKESKKGAGDAEYNYGGKPALQGFTFTAEMANDLLPIGLIDDGAGNDLQVGIERQKNMEARLMVLGINSYAMERLTDDGKRVVINALKYLMKKNAEDISDCSTYFNNGGGDNQWNNPDNWSGKTLPEKTQKVRILAQCVIPSGVKAHVAGVVIAPHDGGMINHGADEADGSLTIEAGGALIVEGKVEAATAPNYFITRATTPTDLVIGSDETNGNGTLIFDNSNGETQATVEYYTKSFTDENTTWNWQYMAVPFNDNSSAHRNYYDSYLYRWKEDCTGWEAVPNRGEVYPWVGYNITQVGNKTYSMDGTLVETGERQFSVPAGKNLVLGNSWTAPIQVKQFEDADFAGMSKNVYLFNTGYDPTKTGEFDKADRYEAGTYVTMPIHSAEYTGDSLISSLQAFIVYAKTDEGGGTFTLDYDRHVRPARSTDKVNAGPMHAPRRGASISEEPMVLKIYASGSRFDDKVVVLERGDFSTGLDDGWDGNKRLAGKASPLIFAVTDNGREAVSAIPDMEGTVIGFWAGEDNEYALRFEYNGDDELYLLDTDNNIYTQVDSENRYYFTVPDKKSHNRFVLTRIAPAPEIATGVEEIQTEAESKVKAVKFLKDDKLVILVNGKLYDATGKTIE